MLKNGGDDARMCGEKERQLGKGDEKEMNPRENCI